MPVKFTRNWWREGPPHSTFIMALIISMLRWSGKGGLWHNSTPFVFLADTFFVPHITKIGADKKSKLKAGK